MSTKKGVYVQNVSPEEAGLPVPTMNFDPPEKQKKKPAAKQTYTGQGDSPSETEEGLPLPAMNFKKEKTDED